ncbi:hypothetical protein [Rhodovibrio salinarum]|uniref:Uncharacterized protein n=1 Tax=Rhodovibrio salinarum TaxID=1087 RepID=A0A934V196_9PROT|nr:hypothetical protein [Rhodovibrio salinarum]MBK1698578.1 hypothetical protein [Rhodovibrio salinarum]
MTVHAADVAQGSGRPGVLRRALDDLRGLKDSLLDTGHSAPDIAQSPGLTALRRTEKALAMPMLALIFGVYIVLAGLILLVFGGFLFSVLVA